MKRHCALLGIALLLCGMTAITPYATAAIVPSPLVKLSTLTGREVQNPQGAKIGKIEDVVIDATSGQIAYAVLSFGGFLGLDETWVVMPWHVLQTTNHGKTFTLDMSEKQLKNAPHFDPNQWPDMEDMHWEETIDDYYGQVPYWRPQLPPMAAHETAQPPKLQFLRSRQALQQDVINTRGQYIGHIEDIVIDTALGKIAYAVLSFDGFLDLGEKWFAIPWSAFEPSAGFRTLTLNVSEEALKKAPGFDKDDWPDMANRRWATAVHRAFGQPPYWERQRQANAAPSAGGKAPKEATGQLPENARKQEVLKASVTVENANGTVFDLLGPVTLACQPQQVGSEDVPANAQTDRKALKIERELVVKRQAGKIQIACRRPASSRDDTPETSKTQP
jgi:sporulation protein YlmC with PRC-barrel domain